MKNKRHGAKSFHHSEKVRWMQVSLLKNFIDLVHKMNSTVHKMNNHIEFEIGTKNIELVIHSHEFRQKQVPLLTGYTLQYCTMNMNYTPLKIHIQTKDNMSKLTIHATHGEPK